MRWLAWIGLWLTRTFPLKTAQQHEQALNLARKQALDSIISAVARELAAEQVEREYRARLTALIQAHNSKQHRTLQITLTFSELVRYEAASAPHFADLVHRAFHERIQYILDHPESTT